MLGVMNCFEVRNSLRKKAVVSRSKVVNHGSWESKKLGIAQIQGFGSRKWHDSFDFVFPIFLPGITTGMATIRVYAVHGIRANRSRTRSTLKSIFTQQRQ
jgi:hypothetical protein